MHKVTTDLERSEVLAPGRNEREEGNHQPVAVTNGILLADWSARCWFALFHQLQPKIEELEAGNDGLGWSRCGRRPVEPRFHRLQPGPVAFRHHHPSDVVDPSNDTSDRS